MLTVVNYNVGLIVSAVTQKDAMSVRLRRFVNRIFDLEFKTDKPKK